MRIILASLTVLATVTLLAGAPRADAHICTNPVSIRVGAESKLNIGVASEDKPVTQVDITIPPGFDLKDQIGYLGWVGTRVGDHAHFEGQTLKPYSCGYFTFVGTATKKGAYFATITVRAEDGTSKEYVDKNPFSPYPAFGIYAGEPIPDAGVNPGGGGGSTSFGVILAVALIAGGVVVAFAYFASNRRSA